MKINKKYKWLFWWTIFSIFVFLFICYIVEHISKNDFNSALLQFGSILIPLFAAIIIMLQNNEQIDTATKLQLEHLQKLNDREIEEMQRLFQKQIDALVDSTNKQIDEFRKMTNEQILALQEGTNRQILSYSEQTEKVVDELSDNSILLGEILKRELEKAILHTDGQIQTAKSELQKVKGFIIGRTDIEKAQQIEERNKYINWLSGFRKRLHSKYKKLMSIFEENEDE